MRAERFLPAITVAAWGAFALVGSGALAPVGAVPLQFTVQGRLTDANGVNRDGAFNITARLWSAATGGTLRYEETKPAVSVVNGNFQMLIGGAPGQPALDQVFTGAVVYLEFQAAGETPMVPRQALLSVPYAVRAQVADSLATPDRFTVALSSVALPFFYYGNSALICLPQAILRFKTQEGQRVQIAFHGSIANNAGYAETVLGIMLDDAPKGSFCHKTSGNANFASPCAMDFLSAPLAAGEHTACLTLQTFAGTAYFVIDGTAENAGRRALFEVRVLGGLP